MNFVSALTLSEAPCYKSLTTSSTELVCFDANLQGTIPETIGLLTALETIWLSHNSLRGSIPSSIQHLAKLTDLDLSRNMLISTIPTEIGKVSNLEIIDLDNNLLEGPIPSEIGALVHMKGIFLEKNKLSVSCAILTQKARRKIPLHRHLDH